MELWFAPAMKSVNVVWRGLICTLLLCALAESLTKLPVERRAWESRENFIAEVVCADTLALLLLNN